MVGWFGSRGQSRRRWQVCLGFRPYLLARFKRGSLLLIISTDLWQYPDGPESEHAETPLHHGSTIPPKSRGIREASRPGRPAAGTPTE